ncbi:MAG TPA: FAD/NAD(P)-binding protein [Solirubrobacteraceae bacterium]|nr:FAD/NAD(P)-binding protein [Solirubrobacteraceae bacterium]
MTPSPHRIVSRRRETADTWTVALEPLPGHELPVFAPGQFGMLYAFGVGEIPISVSGTATRLDPLRCTIRAVGGVSGTLAAVEPGDLVGLRGPFGSTWPLTDAIAGDVVIVAGGLGLAPLRPAIHHLLAHRDEYERVVICYGCRSAAELLYVNEFEEWRRRFDLDIDMIVDVGGPDWHGKVGVVTKLVELAAFDPDNTIAMACGPEIMLRFVALTLKARKLPPERLYISMERNMHCAIAQCGHCQFGPKFICREGPVLRYDDIEQWLKVAQL